MLIQVLLVIAVLVLSVLYLVNRSPKRFPPGPWGLPIVGYNPFLGKNPYKTFHKMRETYGDVFSVPLGTKRAVILNDAMVIREAWKEPAFNGRSQSDMDKVWGGFGTDLVHGIIFSEGPYWVEQRRFALKNLKDLGFGKQNMETLIQNEVLLLCNTMDEMAGKPMEMYHFFDLAAVNSLWTIVTSTRFEHGDKKLQTLIESLMHTFMGDPVTGIRYHCDLILKWFPNFFGWNRMVKAIDTIMNYTEEVVQEHKDTFHKGSPRDFIDVYLEEMKRTTDPTSSFYGITGERSLKMTLLDLFLGGTETTGTTLMWFALLMAKNPEKQKKVQEEVDRIAGTDTRSPPGLHHKKNMTYMEATIHEVLRCSDFVVSGLLHCTTDDIEFKGYFIPKRTPVISNLYLALHDPRYWDKPEEFVPERFLDENNQLKMNPAFLPFGYGKRVCPGEILARTQLFLFCSTLIQRFTFSVVPNDPPSLDIATVGIVSYMHPFRLMITRRNVD